MPGSRDGETLWGMINFVRPDILRNDSVLSSDARWPDSVTQFQRQFGSGSEYLFAPHEPGLRNSSIILGRIANST